MEPLVVALVAIVLVPTLALVGSYNRFVRQRTLVESSWGGVDVELARRLDLIPQLVATVQGYAAHERAMLERLVTAREAATRHHAESPDVRRPFEQDVTQTLRQVLARAEAYPDLKASEHFLHLQAELTNTEDRIAAARRFYNLNIGAYNTRVGTFPSNVVAGLFGFDPREFFELTDARAASVPPVAG